MNNIDYFNFSCQPDGDVCDFSNAEGTLIIAQRKQDNPTILQTSCHQLLDLIITYKTLKNENKILLDEILKRIDTLLLKQNLINYTPFCVYFQVLKYSYSAYKNTSKHVPWEKRSILLKQILDSYLTYRHEMYMSYGYNDSVLQVMSDCATSRRNGKVGIQKVENILGPLGYIKVKTIDDFEKEEYCYLLPDKDGKKAFNTVLEKEKIDFDFFKKRDAKFPDFLIKHRKNIFILEHKMTNGEGGSQNGELNEIIDFIGIPERNKNVSYISCLQGSYFGQFMKNSGKIIAQKKRILTHLKTFPNNYFLNAHGLQKLFQEMK